MNADHRVEVETGILEAECAAIMQTFFRQGRGNLKKQAKLAARPKHRIKRTFANRTNYDIIPIERLLEAGRGGSSSLSEVNCVLFSIALDESSPRDWR